MLKHPALKYFRLDGPGTPHVWCTGCGIGQVWYYTAKAIEELGLDTNKVLWVGGSGCTGRMCTYWYKDYFHTLHGRPLAFATGVKLARPELTVICHMGDGEAAAIGGNHLIQTARRNVELVAICINNFNYGMTGGQFSPRSISVTSKRAEQMSQEELNDKILVGELVDRESPGFCASLHDIAKKKAAGDPHE